MDTQTYRYKKDVDKELATMQGWDAKAVLLYWPDNENANKNGNVWAIKCDDGKYLRTDGEVR